MSFSILSGLLSRAWCKLQTSPFVAVAQHDRCYVEYCQGLYHHHRLTHPALSRQSLPHTCLLSQKCLSLRDCYFRLFPECLIDDVILNGFDFVVFPFRFEFAREKRSSQRRWFFTRVSKRSLPLFELEVFRCFVLDLFPSLA